MAASRLIVAAAMVAALGQVGCAAAFREGAPAMRVESNPPGGVAIVTGVELTGKATPIDMRVPRSGFTEVRVKLAGFEEHHGSVRKRINGWWLTADLATCIVPVLLCVPLLVDAVTGAWTDVQKSYTARLAPLGGVVGAGSLAPNGSIYVGGAPSPASTVATAPSVVEPAGAPATAMSDSERKASARAAYLEALDLQSRGEHTEALTRFVDAQKVFDAPTHLLHIAQCLAVTGKLVEAQEAYETLTRRGLPNDAPGPFRDAVEAGKRELSALRPRIPTLRIEVKPQPPRLRNLAVSMNHRPLPNEVLGIARPVNPGPYRLTATAWGIAPARPIDLRLLEGEAKVVELELGR